MKVVGGFENELCTGVTVTSEDDGERPLVKYYVTPMMKVLKGCALTEFADGIKEVMDKVCERAADQIVYTVEQVDGNAETQEYGVKLSGHFDENGSISILKKACGDMQALLDDAIMKMSQGRGKSAFRRVRIASLRLKGDINVFRKLGR